MATTLTNIQKNRRTLPSGGGVFFGWLFYFTRSAPGSGPALTNASKNLTALTNVAKP